MNITVLIILWIIGLMFYFIPTAVAAVRKHVNSTPIFLLNLFLGGTIIGWIVALIWASNANTRAAQQAQQAEARRQADLQAAQAQMQAQMLQHMMLQQQLDRDRDRERQG